MSTTPNGKVHEHTIIELDDQNLAFEHISQTPDINVDTTLEVFRTCRKPVPQDQSKSELEKVINSNFDEFVDFKKFICSEISKINDIHKKQQQQSQQPRINDYENVLSDILEFKQFACEEMAKINNKLGKSNLVDQLTVENNNLKDENRFLRNLLFENVKQKTPAKKNDNTRSILASKKEQQVQVEDFSKWLFPKKTAKNPDIPAKRHDAAVLSKNSFASLHVEEIQEGVENLPSNNTPLHVSPTNKQHHEKRPNFIAPTNVNHQHTNHTITIFSDSIAKRINMKTLKRKLQNNVEISLQAHSGATVQSLEKRLCKT